MARISVYPPFRTLAGTETLEVDLAPGTDLRHLLEVLAERFPDLRPLVRAPASESLRSQLTVHVNGRPADLDTSLQPSDKLDLLRPVAGGAAGSRRRRPGEKAGSPWQPPGHRQQGSGHHQSSPPRPYTGIVVAHTHWDREWYAPFQIYRIRLVRAVDSLLEIMESDPRFTSFVLDGQTIVLEDYLEVRPQNEERIRRLVKAGRLHVGPWYVLPDEFLVSPESLIRNLIMGARVASRFGATMPVGYSPDAFGHIAQMPQILRGFGMDCFVFTRGLGDEGERLGSEFLWRTPDGSQVLAVRQMGMGGYGNLANLGFEHIWAHYEGQEPQLKLALERVRLAVGAIKPYSTTRYLLLNNGSDHVFAQKELPDLLAEVNRHQAEVELVQGTFMDYIDAVRRQGPRLEVYQGEMRGARYYHLLAGVLSTRMYLKLENFRTLRLLERWAEPFCAVAWLEGLDYPAEFLWLAWKLALQNHPHDSICGCSVDQVHRENMPRYAQAQQIGQHFTQLALAHLANRANTLLGPKGGVPVVVFNPLAGVRDDLVEATVPMPEEGSLPPAESHVPHAAPLIAVDSDGHSSPVQAAPGGKLAFLARAVPSFGYRTFWLLPRPSAATPGPPALEASNSRLANQLLTVEVHSDGSFTLTDRRTGRSFPGLHVLEDVADAGDEYNYSPPTQDTRVTSEGLAARIEMVEAGPVRASIRVSFDLPLPAGLTDDRRQRDMAHLVPCPVVTTISLAAGLPRVDICTQVENRARDHRLRVLFPTGLPAEMAMAEGHFQVMERRLDVPSGEGWREAPSPTNHQRAFVAVEAAGFGLAVANHGLPEYEVQKSPRGAIIALTLLRCVGWLSRGDLAVRPELAGPMLETPEAQCLGRYTFQYSLLPYQDTWQVAGIVRAAHAQNVPLEAVVSDYHTGPLPPEVSFLDVEGDDLQISAVKRWEQGDALVVRVYNTSLRPAAGRVRLYRQCRRVRLADMAERPLVEVGVLPDYSVLLDLRPAQVATLLVEFA